MESIVNIQSFDNCKLFCDKAFSHSFKYIEHLPWVKLSYEPILSSYKQSY